MDIKEVAQNMNKKVWYKSAYSESEYILNACILRLGENGFYYNAELKEINRNAVVIVPLGKVEVRDNHAL